jgi:hypothetical protein
LKKLAIGKHSILIDGMPMTEKKRFTFKPGQSQGHALK